MSEVTKEENSVILWVGISFIVFAMVVGITTLVNDTFAKQENLIENHEIRKKVVYELMEQVENEIQAVETWVEDSCKNDGVVVLSNQTTIKCEVVK